MLKHRDSKWVKGWRSPYWYKRKLEVTVDVVVTGVSDKPTYQTGGTGFRTGEVALTYGWWDPARGMAVTTGQGIAVGPRAELEQYVGRVAEVLCNGVTSSGALRHGRVVRWRDDKPVEECVA